MVIDAGVAEGLFIADDSRLAARLMLSALNGITTW